MDRVVQKHNKEKPPLNDRTEPAPGSALVHGPDRKWFKPLPWLAQAIFIFALLYSSSYMALLLLPPYGGMDMTSQLIADYGPWSFLEFQPVDPAIIEEIQQERGLPGMIVIDGEVSPTPVILFTSTSTARDVPSSTPQPTFDIPPSSPTTSQPTSTLISMPTSTEVHAQPTPTPQPTQAANPTRTRKPPRNQRTPKPPKTPKSN